MRPVFLVLVSLVWVGCEPLPLPDTRPPLLVETQVTPEGDELELRFDEPLAEALSGGDFSPAPVEPSVDGEVVRVKLPPDLKPGQAYQWSAEVRDQGRNLTSVAGRFYGPNGHPATLRLNEVRVAGSGAHTDLVELRVEAPGSLGGWTLEALSGPGARQRFILPDVEGETGDLVVVHFRPSGDPSESDETGGTGVSGGSDAAPGARDFWVSGGKGLSAVKGALVLKPSPDAAPADGLAYAKTAGTGLAIARSAGWTGPGEVDPTDCTATRTWCRSEGQPGDWVLVTTGAATPGRPNTLNPWKGGPATPSGSPKTKGRPTPAPGSG